MRFNRKLLSLFTIFFVLVSASAVCAADLGGYAGSNYHASVENQKSANLEPGAGLPLENQTADDPMNVTGNATTHVTGNTTENATGNATGNSTGNATHNQAKTAPSPKLLSTGNPLIVLIAVLFLLGSFAVVRKNR